ncbi:hypothetical protein Ddye_030346 [Dipteronia dyeriana]|uniref:DUF382 domain-containing protein n=1 Tax=Dipteronia dyeriana TaxID=168575 RepID=A0AAD9TH91_9ROSI|nr:hypothetical protein Ddye_030346 [Dipteronia dyeriana]
MALIAKDPQQAHALLPPPDNLVQGSLFAILTREGRHPSIPAITQRAHTPLTTRYKSLLLSMLVSVSTLPGLSPAKIPNGLPERQPKPQLCSSVSICSTSDLLIRFAQPKAKASLPQRLICSSSPCPIYLNESKVWDAIAADPKLLVFLKAYRNIVPVPRHWCQKRKFFQGKHGIDFIAATGIAKIRQID